MSFYKYDLHTHSCLSPCGDKDMSPQNILNMAMISGCEIIAISDHNSCKNVEVAMKIGSELGLLVVPAMELCTSEEAHVLCLFETLEGALEFDKFVYEKIPNIKNKPHIFGEQEIVDENDVVIGREEKLLITATSIGSWEISELTRKFGGVAIPAHVDKNSYSIIASLGDMPNDCGFTAVEIKDKSKTDEMLAKYPNLKSMKIIHDSDSHYLENMPEEFTEIELPELTLKALIAYFRK